MSQILTLQSLRDDFVGFARAYVRDQFVQESPKHLESFVEQIEYSFLRFGKLARGLLILVLAGQEAEGKSSQRQQIFNWALIVELIHCYSLIHDDMPCADNDSTRRGQPSHHIRYGEANALCMGSVFLVEAFRWASVCYPASLSQVLSQDISEKVGFKGLIGGQLLDLNQSSYKNKMLELKTASLFCLATQGVGKILAWDKERSSLAHDLGLFFGCWFQKMDDLVDGDGLGGSETLVREQVLEKISHFDSPMLLDYFHFLEGEFSKCVKA